MPRVTVTIPNYNHAEHLGDAIDSAGYRIVDLTGSSIFEVMVRFRQENPWKGLDAIRAALPNSTLRACVRRRSGQPFRILPLWVGASFLL